MNNNASQSSEAVRPFARMIACEVTPSEQDLQDGGLFKTVFTAPDRPESDISALD